MQFGFTRKEASTLLDLGIRQLDYLVATFEVQPITIGSGKGKTLLFTFRNLVEIKIGCYLKEEKVPTEYIKSVLKSKDFLKYSNDMYLTILKDFEVADEVARVLSKNYLFYPEVKDIKKLEGEPVLDIVNHLILTGDELVEVTMHVRDKVKELWIKKLHFPSQDTLRQEFQARAKEHDIKFELAEIA